MRWLVVLLFLLRPALAQPDYFLGPEGSSVLNEINLLRTNPQQYVTFLEATRAQYRDRMWNRPGGAYLTKEGVAAVDEAIEALRKQAPLEPLTADLGLTLAARDHVNDQGPTGKTGHGGTDGSQPNQRIERYGAGMRTGENISYGFNVGRDIVIQLLVDDGWPGRGHRVNLLQPAYQQVGVALGPHKEYGVMCVMDFGTGFVDKPGLVATAPARAPRPTPAGWGQAPTPQGGPLEQARTVALAHYQAMLNDDRAAWMTTWSAYQRGTLGQRWFAARGAGAGQEYRYAGTQKVSPSRMTLVFVRGKTMRCLITLVLEGGAWKVEEANY